MEKTFRILAIVAIAFTANFISFTSEFLGDSYSVGFASVAFAQETAPESSTLQPKKNNLRKLDNIRQRSMFSDYKAGSRDYLMLFLQGKSIASR